MYKSQLGDYLLFAIGIRIRFLCENREITPQGAKISN